MKKYYENPQAHIEEFMANQFVAECYEVACSVGDMSPKTTRNVTTTGGWDTVNGYGNPGGAAAWNGVVPNGADSDHNHTGSCSIASNNVVVSSSVGAAIKEHSSDQGWISGYLDSYTDNNGNGICDTGDYVYWHTTATDGRVWCHWGTVASIDSSHPNRS